jgi:formate-nitrite transporter family protein
VNKINENNIDCDLKPGSFETEGVQTERSHERAREENAYVPVIIKRTDETRRHPDDVLESAIFAGAEQLSRPALSLALSSVAAGLILGFTAMSVAVVTVALQPVVSDMILRLAQGLVYPIGFILCITSGTELFTEHTATAVYPVLDRRNSVTSLFRLWFIVALGNLVGAVASAGLLALTDDVIGAREGYIFVTGHLLAFSGTSVFLSALLAGWLMALGTWLIQATPPTVSQILSIYFVTFLIGIGGLHHSIAGAVELFAGLFAGDQFTLAHVSRVIGLALFGNLVGGSIFVAFLNYGHIRQSQAKESGNSD